MPCAVAGSAAFSVGPGGRRDAALGQVAPCCRRANGTQVTLTVLVPNSLSGGPFATRSVASTGPLRTGTLYASTTGTSGEPMTLRFKLDTP